MFKYLIKNFFIVVVILILVGCNNRVDKSLNNLECLKIIEVKIPNNFANPVNLKNLNIKCSYYGGNHIQIIFNKEVQDNDYILGYLQRSNYLEIKPEQDSNNMTLFKYSVHKNIIRIKKNIGFYPSNPASIYIPNNMTAVDGSKMSDDVLLIFSYNAFKEINNTNIVNENVKREIKSIAQIKTKNDNKNIALVNKDSKLYTDLKMTNKSLDLFRGETVIVENYGKNVSYIKIYFPLNNNTDLFCDNINIIKTDNYFILSGYIDSNYLTKICEPLNDSNYYMVKLTNNSESGYPILEYGIYNKLIGGHISIEINDNVKTIESKDIYSLESLLLFYISENSITSSYLSTYAPVRTKGDGLVSRCDIDAHLPEYEWTKDEYNVYFNANNIYSKYILDMLYNYNVTEELLDFKIYFIQKTENCMKLESVWIDWGYYGKLDNSYFYDEILKRIEFSDTDKKEVANIFKQDDIEINDMSSTFINENSSISDQIFGYKITKFYNNYINNDEIMRDFQRVIENITSKYLY